jgi:hypothetical protein
VKRRAIHARNLRKLLNRHEIADIIFLARLCVEPRDPRTPRWLVRIAKPQLTH